MHLPTVASTPLPLSMPGLGSATVVAALIALSGVLLAQIVLIVQLYQAHRRWKAEQARARIIWAAEKATSDDEMAASLGVAVLGAVDGHPELDADDQALISAALEIAVQGSLEPRAVERRVEPWWRRLVAGATRRGVTGRGRTTMGSQSHRRSR